MKDNTPNTTSNNMEGLWIDLNILTDSNLSLQEKFVLAIIKALDKNNGCFASNKYFAHILQVTPKRVSDIIQSLISKKYITSTVEDNYKRTIKVVVAETEYEPQPQEKNVIPLEQPKPKKKPLMWRGIDLSTWTADALERIKKRYKEVELLLQGEKVDESQKPIFRSNEEIGRFKEVPSEWMGIRQLAFGE